MNDDWNPHFPRKRKRNRVANGRPSQRRYFALPILGLIVGVFCVRLAGPVILRYFSQRSEAQRQIELLKAERDSQQERLVWQGELIDSLSRQLTARQRVVWSSGESGTGTLTTGATGSIHAPAVTASSPLCLWKPDGDAFFKVRPCPKER